MIGGALRIFGMVEVGLLAVGSVMSALDTPSVAVRAAPVPPVPGEAEEIARQFLATVDWSSPTLLIWLHGINASGMRHEFRDAMGAARSPFWAGSLEYPGDPDMRRNRAIGIRALELVLEEIRRRDPDGTRYRVAIAADSLGAWVANEAMLRPAGEVVDAMATFGKSAPSSPLPPDRARRVRDYRNGLDFAIQPYIGWSELWTQAGDFVFGAGLSRLPATILHGLLNPFPTLVAAVTWIEFQLRGAERGSGFREHPHNYWRDMPAAVRWLVDGA